MRMLFVKSVLHVCGGTPTIFQVLRPAVSEFGPSFTSSLYCCSRLGVWSIRRMPAVFERGHLASAGFRLEKLDLPILR